MNTPTTIYTFVNDGKGGLIAVHAHGCPDTKRAEVEGLSVWYIGANTATVAIRCEIGDAADNGQKFVQSDFRVMPCVVSA